MSGLDAAHSHCFRDLPVSLAAEEVLSAPGRLLSVRRLLVWHEGVNFGIVRANCNKLYKQMDHAF